MPRPAEPTRTLLIETAERLFAERGIEAVSLRDVSAEAGQRNHSAAQYHFGDRAGLVAAVFNHRMAIVNDRRHALLDEVGDAPSLVDVVRAVVEPLVNVVAETDGWYGRFLVRARWDTFAADVVAELPVLSSFRRAGALLQPHLVALRPRVRAARLDQLGTVLVGTIAGWEWRRQRGEPSLSARELQAELVATTCALLTAPSHLHQEVS